MQVASPFNILHLTDLHFREAERAGERAHREIVLSAMLKQWEQLLEPDQGDGDPHWQLSRSSWEPHVIVLSGDLAFAGKATEYDACGEFLTRLREVIRRPDIPVIACPGNHDRNSKYSAGIAYPQSSAQADHWLSVEQLQPDLPPGLRSDGLGAADPGAPARNIVASASSFSDSFLTVPFRNFQDFCERQRFLRPAGITGLEYLTGSVRWPDQADGVEFVVLNSAWFCNHVAEKDARNLWLGLPILEWLEYRRLREDAKPCIRIALVHHPREWLHEEECNAYSDRPNTYRLLADSTDLILSGHVHGTLEPPSAAYSGALVITGGASYLGGRWRNNFSLLQVNLENRTVSRRGFEFDPRERAWVESTRAKTIHSLPLRTAGASERGELGAVAADVRASELVGNWDSVFWVEGRPDVSKWRARVRFEVNDAGVVVGNTVAPDRNEAGARPNKEYRITGTMADGYLTGVWDSPGKPHRRGTIQVGVYRRGGTLEMRGRWLGYDRRDKINVGSWIFTLLPAPPVRSCSDTTGSNIGSDEDSRVEAPVATVLASPRSGAIQRSSPRLARSRRSQRRVT